MKPKYYTKHVILMYPHLIDNSKRKAKQNLGARVNEK